MRTAKKYVMWSIGNIQSALSFPALAHYYDNQFSGQVFQNTNLTTPAANGEVVGSWADRIGSATISQATAANKPINRLTAGVEFDGTNDALTGTITTLPATGFTLYYRVFPDDFDAVQVHVDWGNMSISSTITAGRISLAHSGVGAIGTSTAALTVSANNVVGVRYNPTSGAWRVMINAQNADSGTQARAVSGTGLSLATENGVSFPFDGKIIALAIHTTLHTDTVMTEEMAYWRSLT